MKLVPIAVSTRAARSILLSQKHSPRTLFIGGLIGVGATIVLACRATLDVDAVLQEAEHKQADVALLHASNPSSRTAKKDKAYVVGYSAIELTKLYGPAILCGTVSVAALAGSHNILTKRNTALAVAYGTIDKAFNEYRGRVRESVGDKKELEIYRDVAPCEIEDPETGKKEKVRVSNGGGPYSFLFDQSNRNYEKTADYNYIWLKMQQSTANDRLQARGHLFLNDLLLDLGFEHTTAGAVTGWIKGQGDDYVDFGIFTDQMSETVLDFIAGREKAIWLNFNVDGTIYDKI